MQLLLACRIWIALLHNALLKLCNRLQDTGASPTLEHFRLWQTQAAQQRSIWTQVLIMKSHTNLLSGWSLLVVMTRSKHKYLCHQACVALAMRRCRWLWRDICLFAAAVALWLQQGSMCTAAVMP